MTLEEGFLDGTITVADFAQHPADGLVDEVVGVVPEDGGDAEGVGEIVLPDEVKGREDGDAAFPQGR